nr:hypothetical protein [Anaerolineae bacterium]
MPNITLEQLIPPYPLHWTTILHYLILIGSVTLLTIAGDRTSLMFVFVLAVLALAVGVDLYAYLIQVPRITIFFIRVIIFGTPLILAGLSGTGGGQTLAIIMAAMGLALLVLVFASCWLGPNFGDPRLFAWCV